MKRRLIWSLAALGIVGLAASGLRLKDQRAYMHGIESVEGNDGSAIVFFSSSALPPTGKWGHDIYVSRWSSKDANLSEPRIFIQKPEAQEPVSVAQTSDHHIMVSFEDGWNSIPHVSQRYGVYDADLKPIAPYPLDVDDNGHSGHVAAVGNKFVVFYSQNWIRRGWTRNSGTGYGVYAAIYDSNGRLLHKTDVAAHVQEWWPIIAGSRDRALLAWQQFVPDHDYANLKIAMLDPDTGALSGERVLQADLQYYTYTASYVAELNRFLIVGTTLSGNGFAYLLDNKGNTVATLPCMPATIREAGVVINNAMAYVPSKGNKLLHVSLAATSITLKAVQPSTLKWFTMGNTGLVRDDAHLHWVSLSRKGLQEADFDLGDAKAPSARDRCDSGKSPETH